MLRHFFWQKRIELFNPIQRKYGEQTDIYFALYTQSGNDTFYKTTTIDTGDMVIGIDGISATVANSINTAQKYSNGINGIYKMTLEASEMTGKHIDIRIVDGSTPQAYKDTCIFIETYGHDSAQHRMDMDFPTLALNFTSTAVGSTTTVVCDALGITSDVYIDRAIIFKDGTLDKRVAFIEDYTYSTGNDSYLAISQVHTTCASGQEFFIL
jgi:hypothetical protein